LVQQEFEVARLNTATLFAIGPFLFVDEVDQRLFFDAKNDRLYRGQGRYSYPFEYTLLTSGLAGGRQLAITPCEREPDPYDFRFRLRQPVDEKKHRGLRQMAAEVVADAPADDVVARARALERYLRDLGGFRYTLSPPYRDPKKRDPIEDFVVHNRLGHCEYFASALTLMLRSVGIPARMCVGFKGADWNPLTSSYHVRQWHAHTWVEVYLRPDQFPPGTIEDSLAQIPREQWMLGGWLRLDPTPAFEGADLMPPTTYFPSIRQLLDYIDHLWSGYVLSMDARRQREGVFNPLKEGTEGVVTVLFDPDLWTRTFRNLWKIMKGEKLDDTGLWFSWRAAVLSFVSLTLLLFLYRGATWVVRRLVRIARPPESSAQDLKDAEVEFYRRLETLLAQRRLVRLPTQTQKEFALQVGDELAADPRTLHVAGVPRRIADIFYRVRFGQEHLLPLQLESIDRGLTELSAAFAAADVERASSRTSA
jgi:transglutaminase-like putative cysteine protease